MNIKIKPTTLLSTSVGALLIFYAPMHFEASKIYPLGTLCALCIGVVGIVTLSSGMTSFLLGVKAERDKP